MAATLAAVVAFCTNPCQACAGQLTVKVPTLDRRRAYLETHHLIIPSFQAKRYKRNQDTFYLETLRNRLGSRDDKQQRKKSNLMVSLFSFQRSDSKFDA
jgi:hypothetical protein